MSAPDTHGADPSEIHMPPPSLAPLVISFGVMLLALGIVYGLALVAIGGVILVAGLATWLIDDARAFGAGSDHGGH